MSKLKANILANTSSQFLVIIVQLITLPIYLKILGVEAYGLIGLYTTLQMTIQAFDFGLGNTINREMAKYNAGAINKQKAINTVVTIEALFLGLIVFFLAAICLAVPFYYTEIISAEKISRDALENTLYLMTALIGLLWIGSLYQNGLMGLEKQVFFNAMRSLAVIANPVITFTALFVFGPHIQVFFLSQIFFSFIFVTSLRYVFLKKLDIPRDVKPTYSFEALAGLKQYMLGTGLISIISVCFAVSDRWILINIVNLKEFAHYTLALTMSNGLSLIATPVFAAVLPRFTSLISIDNINTLKKIYSLISKFLAIIVFSLSIHLILYANEIFFWWLGDKGLAQDVSLIAQFLVLGTAINAMMILPFAILLSQGWTKIGIYMTLGQLLFFAPLSIYFAILWGPIGCGIAWAILNVTNFIIGGLFIGEKLNKVFGIKIPIKFIITTFMLASLIGLAFKSFYNFAWDPIFSLFYIGTSLTAAILTLTLSTNETNTYAIKLLHKLPTYLKSYFNN